MPSLAGGNHDWTHALEGHSSDDMVRRGVAGALLASLTALGGVATSPVATAAVSSHTSHTSGCVQRAGAYPGARSTDCVALSNDTVFVDHTVVSAKWSLTADEFGFTNLCAAVTIRNQNKSTYFFNDFNMTLRPPKGSVTVLNFTAKHALDDGFIPPPVGSRPATSALTISAWPVNTSGCTHPGPAVRSEVSGSSTSARSNVSSPPRLRERFIG